MLLLLLGAPGLEHQGWSTRAGAAGLGAAELGAAGLGAPGLEHQGWEYQGWSTRAGAPCGPRWSQVELFLGDSQVELFVGDSQVELFVGLLGIQEIPGGAILVGW